MSIMFSLLNAGPFHGWFTIQFTEHNTIGYLALMVLLAGECIFWTLLFLMTLLIVVNLVLHTQIAERNKESSYVAYGHTLA